MLLGKTYSPLQLLKPANYEISKTRKYKNDIGKIENMEHDKISDFYTCKNNSKLTVSHIRHNKTKTGYVSEKTMFLFSPYLSMSNVLWVKSSSTELYQFMAVLYFL